MSRTDVNDCRECPLGSLGYLKTDGFGPVDVDVAVVGINPSVRGRDGTVALGAFLIPFLARMQSRGWSPTALPLAGAERAFAAIASEAGLDLSWVYSTNVVKCATPSNRKPESEEVRTCVGRYLRGELESLRNLRTILVFGKVAGAALGLGDFGETRKIEGTEAVGILLRHPVATLRKWTRLSTEATNVRSFLSTSRRSSTTEGSAPARR